MKNIIQAINKHKYQIILWTFVVVYIIYFSYLSILRYKTLYASYFDLGIMNQTVYNTQAAISKRDPTRILEMTDTDGMDQIKRMAIHSDIILVLLAPFYFIFAGPETLLVIQTIIVALGAVFIFGITTELLTKSKQKQFAGLIFALAYLLYPPVERANLFDFHAVVLATTFLLGMFYFWLRRRYKLSLLFFLLGIFSKEQVAITTMLFGVYSLFSGRKQKGNKIYSLSIVGASLVWFVLSVFFLIPTFRGHHHFALERYSDFGDSPIRIIIGILKSPYSIVKHITQIESLRYFFFLFSPLGFLSLLSPPLIFVATPELAINILSNNTNMRNIFFHYTAVITPFIFIAAIYGARKMGSRGLFLISLYVLSWSLILSYFKGPLPYSREREIHPFIYPQKEANQVAFWAKTLKDENLRISSTGQLAPFFTARRFFYNFSKFYYRADYVILRTSEVYDYPEKNELIPVYEQLKKDDRYEIIYKNGQLEVYKRVK